MRRSAQDPRCDRRSDRDREDPHAPGPARPCAAALPGAGDFSQPRSLTRVQNDGSATEPTGVFGPLSRDGVKARRVKADSGRSRVRIVTVRGDFSPVSARLTARSTANTVPACGKRRLKSLFAGFNNGYRPSRPDSCRTAFRRTQNVSVFKPERCPGSTRNRVRHGPELAMDRMTPDAKYTAEPRTVK